MAHFVSLRKRGLSVEHALEQAASAVLLGERPLSPWTLRTWLKLFIRHDGRIVPSHAGRHISTASFLDDPDRKEQARVWLIQNCRAAQAKGSKELQRQDPLRPSVFQKWVNETLLKDLRSEPGTDLEGICEKTAQN